MEDYILGENASLEEVRSDLNLIREIEDTPVTVEWELDTYETLNLDGSLRLENLKEEGSLTELTARLVCGERGRDIPGSREDLSADSHRGGAVERDCERSFGCGPAGEQQSENEKTAGENRWGCGGALDGSAVFFCSDSSVPDSVCGSPGVCGKGPGK